MQVNKINNQKTKHNQSFKSVRIQKDQWNNLMLLSVSVRKSEEDNIVKFVNGSSDPYLLGTSLAAEKATKMLKKFGEHITDPNNVKKMKKLLKQIVDVDIMPELEKKLNIPGTRSSTYTLKEVIGETSLADLKTVTKKGKPVYYSDNSFGMFALKMDPNEEVNVKISRSNLAQLGIKQP